ncbi:MAG TPA: hypothetical protein VNH11_18200 [Pirellulales bacterium]|nr:hypothetical protein [Pirellulales bacterium]
MPKREKTQPPVKRTTADERPPSQRDCGIYEQHILRGETQLHVAAAHALSQQRVAQIAARVEAWLAAHPEHPLAQSLRLRCARRWETLWDESMASFARSRQNREIKKERTARRKATAGGEALPVTTVVEQTVREQNGDPRFLSIARGGSTETNVSGATNPVGVIRRGSVKLSRIMVCDSTVGGAPFGMPLTLAARGQSDGGPFVSGSTCRGDTRVACAAE